MSEERTEQVARAYARGALRSAASSCGAAADMVLDTDVEGALEAIAAARHSLDRAAALIRGEIDPSEVPGTRPIRADPNRPLPQPRKTRKAQ